MSITSTLVHRAEIQFHEAADVLRPYVGCFWVITAERDATIRIVPDGSTSISIHLQDGDPSDWFLRGPLVRPEELRFTLPATLIGVRLHPGVAFLLTRIPTHTITGCRVRLSSIPVHRAQTHEQRIDTLERFLIERLTTASLHVVVAGALQEIGRDHGCLRVSDIASRLHVSSRHLNRLMRTWVGYGAKRYAEIVRFQTTLKEIEHSPSQPAAALAFENGYFDQAHLSMNLARFAGATPRHLASSSVADFYKTRCDDTPYNQS
jgi:AraC-like DNA-binding protein